MDLANVFTNYQKILDEDQDLREVFGLICFLSHILKTIATFFIFCVRFQEIRLIVRELDQTAREISLVLQQIHQTDGLTKSIPVFTYIYLWKLIESIEFFLKPKMCMLQLTSFATRQKLLLPRLVVSLVN